MSSAADMLDVGCPELAPLLGANGPLVYLLRHLVPPWRHRHYLENGLYLLLPRAGRPETTHPESDSRVIPTSHRVNLARSYQKFARKGGQRGEKRRRARRRTRA